MFKVTIIDEALLVKMFEEEAAYKKAKAEMLETPWWNVVKRNRLYNDFHRHLGLCVDYHRRAIRVEPLSTESIRLQIVP